MIALIEDNQTDVFLVKQAIAARHLDVDLYVMEDGEMAVKLIAEIDGDERMECPSLVLLDLNLPKMGGFEVLSRLRSSERCADVPVVVMTSSSAREDRDQSATYSASAYFRKPSAYDDFMKIGDIIQKLLG